MGLFKNTSTYGPDAPVVEDQGNGTYTTSPNKKKQKHPVSKRLPQYYILYVIFSTLMAYLFFIGIVYMQSRQAQKNIADQQEQANTLAEDIQKQIQDQIQRQIESQ